MIHRILEDFGFYNHSRFLETSMTEDNIRAMGLISILAFFSSCLFLEVSYTSPGYAVPVYRYTNYAAAVVSACVFAALKLFRRNILASFHRFHACMFVYIVWLTYCGMTASFTDSRNGGGFIAFLISQIWIYDLILIPPFVSVIFCGGAFAVFTGLISNLMFFPRTKYVETAIFYVTIIAVNYFHYRSALTKINREEAALIDNDRLDRLSTTDELTDVRNRMGLREDFEYRFSDHLFVLMCDIDHFKQYNDKLGHETGDTVLSEFALALSREFGRDNVYRYGGDEFLVMMADTDEEQFREKIQRARRAYGRLRFGNMANPTGSWGYVYGQCHNSDELREMIKAADGQLYEAKREGRDRICGAEFHGSDQD